MDINDHAEIFAQKIRQCIIRTFGHTEADASKIEFYFAFSQALREAIMINWVSTYETFEQKKSRLLYYLSMEYLPGRFIGNNITNMGATDLVSLVLKKMNRKLSDLVQCESDPALGNGGLGRLASCFLDSLATMDYPAMGYGLRYQYGVFEQEFWDGVQVERPDCWLLNNYPWELRQDQHAANVYFRGNPIQKQNMHGEDIFELENYERVRALPFDVPIIGFSKKTNFAVLTLRLWSTKESPRNFQLQRFNEGFLDQASENTSLTDVLYPNDQTEMGRRVRLKQELLLVSASLKNIVRRHQQVFGDLHSFKEKVRIQINDTHPALAIAELIRLLMKTFNSTWKEAVETTQICCSYTNHTILSEALEEWSEKRCRDLLPRQFLIIEKLNHEFCTSIRAKYLNDEERVRRLSIIEHGRVKMAHLAIAGSHKVNGVAALHTEILKSRIFKDFYEMSKEKFVNVTNGVTPRRWLHHINPLLSDFITKRIGNSWITDFRWIEKLAEFAADADSQKEFLAIKHQNKQALLDFLASSNPLRNEKGQIIDTPLFLDSGAIFDVQVKRFHEYKRQLLNALHLIMLYHEQKKSQNRLPRLCIFGGKAASSYVKAKQVIQLIAAISRTMNHDSKINVVLVENYNVSKAEKIIPAADLSEQISTAGWEASGTGNMKFAINGALTIGTDDGANVEMHQAVTDQWWPFLFGASAEENAHAHHYKGHDIYSSDESIRQAVDSLIDGTFARTPSEEKAFAELHASLLHHDRFFVLRDLSSYYETQKKVEDLYQKPKQWAETAIHNIAAMGRFSSDESIQNYARNIWDLKPCEITPDIFKKVQKEYSDLGI